MTPNIRLARDEDGPAIGQLYAACQWEDYGADWKAAKVRGWWLVAEDDEGRVIGAIQPSGAHPFGYISEVLIHPDSRGRGPGLTKRGQGRLAHNLFYAALAALAAQGCEFVTGAVRHDNSKVLTLLAPHGIQHTGAYTGVIRRLR